MNEIRSLNFSKIICRKPNPALFIGILMLLILSFGVNAQVTTATLVGTISDPSGGQLPNVKVTARNMANRVGHCQNC